jgi:hypothetical protein
MCIPKEGVSRRFLEREGGKENEYFVGYPETMGHPVFHVCAYDIFPSPSNPTKAFVQRHSGSSYTELLPAVVFFR